MAEFRQVSSVCVKRLHPRVRPFDIGHWWFELGDDESYGWWPEHGITRTDFVLRREVPGILNGSVTLAVLSIDGKHGVDGDEEFYPLVAKDDRRSNLQIMECLRGFAREFGNKNKPIYKWGQDCHTFQEEALSHCDLIIPPHIKESLVGQLKQAKTIDGDMR